MSNEPFPQRVQMLRDAWIERRQVKSFASAHDYESQYRLLLTLHEWATHAIEGIRAVYGEAVPIVLSPIPNEAAADRAFNVAVAGTYTVNFALHERPRAGSSRWSIAASVISNAPGGSVAAAGPERRNGQWTRSRLEDLLLSALGAYERARSERETTVLGTGPALRH